MRLPALTLTDPWASLCVAGIKTLETRKGPVLSKFKGALVIHRSKDPCHPYDLGRWGLRLPSRPEGWPPDDAGLALGVVYVQGTTRHSVNGLLPITAEDRRRACFEDIEGRYLSELICAAWFPEPFKATGAQGRFYLEVPAEFVPRCMGGKRLLDPEHPPHEHPDEDFFPPGV